ncbi:MAG: hypothetical protein AB7F36_04890 [Reyranellaceae bacterium]
MGRVVLLLLILFAAPMAVWFGWRWWRRRGQADVADLAPATTAERWQDAPWTWLVGIGLALAVVAVLGFGVLDERDCDPLPTQIIDGKLVPAHCR